jgi:hypothetical protein
LPAMPFLGLADAAEQFNSSSNLVPTVTLTNAGAW